MELLVKETLTLHKVLSRYLAAPVVEVSTHCPRCFVAGCSDHDGFLKFVMTQVYAAINHRLSEEFTRVELPSQGAKELYVKKAMRKTES